MPILAGIVILIQLCFVIHAMKTGRPYWWIVIFMGFAAMGCIIYYFVEVSPSSRDHRTVHQAARKLVKALQPDAHRKRRAEELEICGCVDNRKALAEECVNHQMYDEVVKLYGSCLAGAHQGDGVLLFGLARATIEQKNWDKAKAAVARLKADGPKLRPFEARLLEARVLQRRGENDAALGAYRELIFAYVGVYARYRYAAFLLSLGQHEAAHHMFDEVLKHAKRFSSGVEDEQRWALAARQAITGQVN